MACALAVALVCGGPFSSSYAYADVRKADIVFGQSVETRGLAVAQCPNIDAEYALVMDAEGTVYFERNATSPTQIASITKIMTAIVAMDTLSLDAQVSVSAPAAAIGESSAGLKAGDSMDVETALKALLVPSGNDAAVALADAAGAALLASAAANGTELYDSDGAAATTAEDAFVAAMNAKASELGCVNTVFENPHGLDYDEFAGDQHSCAADVANMVQYAMKNETFRAIVGGGDATVEVTRLDGTPATILLETTDELMETYEYAIGVKTGFTALAGPSFAGAANNGDKELYAIVLDSSSEAQRFDDATTLFEWVYEHEQDYPLAHSDTTASMVLDGQTLEVPVVAEVAHSDWIDTTVQVTLADPEATVRIFDLNGNISQSLSFDQVKGDVKAGDKVGTITFKQRNVAVAEMDLVACEDVAAPGLLESIVQWWDRLFRGFSGQPQVAQSITLNETPLVNDKTAVAGVAA